MAAPKPRPVVAMQSRNSYYSQPPPPPCRPHPLCSRKYCHYRTNRRPRSHSSTSCYAGARGPCEAIRDGPNSASPSCGSGDDAFAAPRASGNRRGRGHAPRNNDLGFGSERMRSESRDYDSDHRSRRGGSGVGSGGRRSSHRDIASASRVDSSRARSLSLGAERRYGDWARSSVQHLLRHDGWLGVRSSPTAARPASAGGYPSDRAVRPSSADHRMAELVSGTNEPAGHHQDSLLASASLGGRCNHSLRSYSRHPAQVTQRRATPYATDKDGFSPKGGGVRSGGGDGRGRGMMRRRSAATSNPGAPSARTRYLVRVSSQIETLGLRNKQRHSAAGSSGRGGTGYAGAGAKSPGESWRRGRRSSSNEPRSSGWSAEAYCGREISPTLRWDESRVFPVG